MEAIKDMLQVGLTDASRRRVYFAQYRGDYSCCFSVLWNDGKNNFVLELAN